MVEIRCCFDSFLGSSFVFVFFLHFFVASRRVRVCQSIEMVWQTADDGTGPKPNDNIDFPHFVLRLFEEASHASMHVCEYACSVAAMCITRAVCVYFARIAADTSSQWIWCTRIHARHTIHRIYTSVVYSHVRACVASVSMSVCSV